jgi:hypothetical protein
MAVGKIGEGFPEAFVQRSITEQSRCMKTMSSVKKRCEGCKVRLEYSFSPLNFYASGIGNWQDMSMQKRARFTTGVELRETVVELRWERVLIF